MGQFLNAAKTSEIPPGATKIVELGGNTLVIFNVGGKFYCLNNTCKHMGGPVGEGEVEEATVTCPWHGWKYDIKTGNCLNVPSMHLETFETKVQGGDVLVKV